MKLVRMLALFTLAAIAPPTQRDATAQSSATARTTTSREAGVILAPKDAHAKAMAGELILIDVRTPDEWKETGVPEPAHMITMHQSERTLLAALDAALAGDRAKPVALICRTGNRTSFLQAELRKRGYSTVLNVAEGVAGGPFGPGWIKSGLPVRKPQ